MKFGDLKPGRQFVQIHKAGAVIPAIKLSGKIELITDGNVKYVNAVSMKNGALFRVYNDTDIIPFEVEK